MNLLITMLAGPPGNSAYRTGGPAVKSIHAVMVIFRFLMFF